MGLNRAPLLNYLSEAKPFSYNNSPVNQQHRRPTSSITRSIILSQKTVLYSQDTYSTISTISHTATQNVPHHQRRDDQFQFLISCIRHSNNEKVASLPLLHSL